MQNNDFKVTRNERTFFTTLNFSVETNNIITYIQSSLHKFLTEYSISEKSITNIHIEKIEENNIEMFSITIKYCKLDQYELKSKDIPEQIRTVLNHMRYSDEDIKEIVYKKYWSNSDEMLWVVKIHDTHYNFDPGDELCERDYYISIHKTIREILGFQVMIEFV